MGGLGFVCLFEQADMPAEVALPLSLMLRLLFILLPHAGASFYVRRRVLA